MASFDLFLKMSEELCCIPAYYLMGTGFGSVYFDRVLTTVGEDTLTRLLAVFAGLPACCQTAREAAIDADLLGHAEFGPVVRNTMKLWFVATWYPLPDAWLNTYKLYGDNTLSIPTPYAYTESLLGPAVGAHPAGAKPTGHQSWISAPDYLPFARAVAPLQCFNADQH